MISIWTRTVTVAKTGKTHIMAFSNFKHGESIHQPPCMDDCEITRGKWIAGKNLIHSTAHRVVAEKLRDEYSNGVYKTRCLYGGMTLRPSGHRRFYLEPQGLLEGP